MEEEEEDESAFSVYSLLLQLRLSQEALQERLVWSSRRLLPSVKHLLLSLLGTPGLDARLQGPDHDHPSSAVRSYTSNDWNHVD